jgi:peptidoglycan/LPS O-acetylase OafA/YrhL
LQYHEPFWTLIGTVAPIIALANVVSFGQAMDAKARLSPQENDFSTLGKAIFSLARLGHPYFVILCFLSSGALIMISATSLWLKEDALPGFWIIVMLAATLILLFILAVCSASFNRKLEDWKIARKID